MLVVVPELAVGQAGSRMIGTIIVRRAQGGAGNPNKRKFTFPAGHRD